MTTSQTHGSNQTISALASPASHRPPKTPKTPFNPISQRRPGSLRSQDFAANARSRETPALTSAPLGTGKGSNATPDIFMGVSNNPSINPRSELPVQKATTRQTSDPNNNPSPAWANALQSTSRCMALRRETICAATMPTTATTQ